MTSPAEEAGRNARPVLGEPEIEAVARVLHGGQLGHGPETEAFEAELSRFLGVPDVVAVGSGTVALHIALLAAGVGPGDEVLVPSLTFCASVQAILAVGARPRFVEVSPRTLCVEADSVLAAVTPATRAVMAVLYGGRAVDLSGAQDVLDALGITVIEDAAHAFGSYSGAERVGATGALTCFSFDPIKNLTCGDGGAIVPRDDREARVARSLRGLGIVQSPAQRARVTSYSVEGFGMRAHLPALNAAVGRVQLGRFAEVESRRKQLWRWYEGRLRRLEGVALVDVDVDRTVPFNCVVRAPARDEVFRAMQAEGVGVGVPYPPNHLQPAFAEWHRSLPVTEAVGGEILSLPFHPAMSDAAVDHAVSALEQAVRFCREEVSR
ncbi:DegT/DnrJ/EryC1/StrS family aminotransferase [Streptomyces sp. WMMC940]|uniref:DegT/DnrJ/EryC1/StrS family aminotransferase n=1 Tax=Streptomyces sp. WMMC940 TaxID=3015153 RepID=UPI0022B60B95|nr:DegT/DnrJ/EryC1/StrS family aminotransferase [Streptomyces sp. WMMC940]MCZ7458238.1 DegT/DnrJ/EryC1/StrS family aminotransferase [Streptomyces sp. WMMC940]